MRNVRGSAAPTGGTSSEGREGTLYIINLCSANTPMLLEAPDAPEFGGLAVFRSRRVEDGRDRFRLHLGYFDTQEQAEKLLPLVRERYPAAWVALAPREGMGSLDDTSVAQFKFIPQRAPATPAQPPAARPFPPTAPAAAPSTVAAAPNTAAASRAATVPAEPFLKPAEVLNLLEAGSSARPTVARKVPARTPAAAPAPAKIEALAQQPQRFAVQLIWSQERPDVARIPRLALFDAYTLYTVTVQRAGRVWYGLRLGFFSDPVSARQVALYVRSDFSAAAVVPVSERECGRAEEAARVAMEKEAAAREAERQRAVAASRAPRAATLVTAPAAPQSTPTPSAIAAAQTQFRASLAALERASDSPPPKVKKPARSTPPAPRARKSAPLTTEELIEELGAHEISLVDERGDPLTDTGVRHLSVAVVKRKRRFGKLFSRSSGA